MKTADLTAQERLVVLYSNERERSKVHFLYVFETVDRCLAYSATVS